MFLKGQIVYLETIEPPHKPRDGKIVKGVVTIAGRSYYTVKVGAWEHRFYKDTLSEHVEMGGAKYRLFPSEQAVYDDRERDRLHAAVRAAVGMYNCDLNLDQLRRIYAILHEEEKL